MINVTHKTMYFKTQEHLNLHGNYVVWPDVILQVVRARFPSDIQGHPNPPAVSRKPIVFIVLYIPSSINSKNSTKKSRAIPTGLLSYSAFA